MWESRHCLYGGDAKPQVPFCVTKRCTAFFTVAGLPVYHNKQSYMRRFFFIASGRADQADASQLSLRWWYRHHSNTPKYHSDRKSLPCAQRANILPLVSYFCKANVSMLLALPISIIAQKQLDLQHIVSTSKPSAGNTLNSEQLSVGSPRLRIRGCRR